MILFKEIGRKEIEETLKEKSPIGELVFKTEKTKSENGKFVFSFEVKESDLKYFDKYGNSIIIDKEDVEKVNWKLLGFI